jgi:hypothetical protein
MQILLDASQSPTGRLSGTARQAGTQHAISFSGTLELLAAIEELFRTGTGTGGGVTEPGQTRSTS